MPCRLTKRQRGNRWITTLTWIKLLTAYMKKAVIAHSLILSVKKVIFPTRFGRAPTEPNRTSQCGAEMIIWAWDNTLLYYPRCKKRLTKQAPDLAVRATFPARQFITNALKLNWLICTKRKRRFCLRRPILQMMRPYPRYQSYFRA